MTLTELYNRKQDVRQSEIPKEWEDKFNKFIFGQTCGIDTKTGESIYWYSDFAQWYRVNEKQIKRLEKIDEL